MRRSSLFNRTRYSPSHDLPVTMSLLSSLNQITPSLYLGNAHAAGNRSLVLAKGITCIVNASLEVVNPPWSGVEAVRVPVADLPHARLSDHFDAVADRIHQVGMRSGRTLVHCVAGVSRSASLCMAYLMKYERISLLEAHRWVKSRRPIVRPNAGFWRQLMEYEHQLFGKNSVKMVSSPMGVVPDIYDRPANGANHYWVSW
ncbi:dual specificity protein phosphatase 18-like [Latimeria chalumnae]|uniref:dual specificity protein phosphatase 18-like n=1 Tax=Latimeria chalumnae TaxID=7897 RepID=UPI0003C1819D|nr:PREDICTED: dual specificity protein phosphatase 18-like [Latimeria chalumnae]|eukprot:XP_014354563.1 PREDICTED: dual specificity protein phosphatase 18-like [Latimeria chalumnae]